MYGKLIGAMVTPFDSDNEIDYSVVDKLLLSYSKSGHSTIVIFGTTGECSSLSIGEKIDLLQHCQKQCEMKIIVGVCENDTKKAVDEITILESYKPDGFLVVVPYYIKPPQRGIFLHFKKCALAARKIPIIIYNVPHRTGVNVDLVTVKKIVKVNKNVVGIKEASNDYNFMKLMKENIPNFSVYYGNDKDFLLALQNNVDGIISVSSIIYGKEYNQLLNDFKDGFINHILADYLSFIGGLITFESNPIPIKYLLTLNGYESMNLRLPLLELSNEGKRLLEILQ